MCVACRNFGRAGGTFVVLRPLPLDEALRARPGDDRHDEVDHQTDADLLPHQREQYVQPDVELEQVHPRGPLASGRPRCRYTSREPALLITPLFSSLPRADSLPDSRRLVRRASSASPRPLRPQPSPRGSRERQVRMRTPCIGNARSAAAIAGVSSPRATRGAGCRLGRGLRHAAGGGSGASAGAWGGRR